MKMEMKMEMETIEAEEVEAHRATAIQFADIANEVKYMASEGRKIELSELAYLEKKVNDLSDRSESREAIYLDIANEVAVYSKNDPGISQRYADRAAEYKRAKEAATDVIELQAKSDIEYISNVFDQTLLLEDEVADPRFIKWLADKKGFTVKQHGRGVLSPEYEFECDVTEKDPKSSIIWNVRYKGATKDGELSDEAFNAIRTDMREFYDEWAEENNRNVMKRAGIAAAIGTSVIALITGLSLGLKRAGNDMSHAGGGGTGGGGKPSTPWSEVTKAGGCAIAFLGNNVYLAIGVGSSVIVYKTFSRKKK